MIKLNSFQGHKYSSTYANQSMWYTTSTKDKNHTIISIDAEKAFDIFPHLFMIKTLIRGNIAPHNKSYFWQRVHNTQQWKAKSLPAEIWNNQNYLLSSLLFNIVLEILFTAIRQEKEIKGIQIGRKEVNLSLYANDMILYIENPKDSI